MPRQLPIRKNVEIAKFGYTPGCPRCDATQHSRSTAFTEHSQSCRQRFEAAAGADPALQHGLERQHVRFADRMLESTPSAQPSHAQATTAW